MADFIQPLPAMSDLILYTTEDGSTAIQLRAEEGTVWLTQAEMADLFATTKQNISLHIKNILAESELGEATVKDSLTTAADGKNYRTQLPRPVSPETRCSVTPRGAVPE